VTRLAEFDSVSPELIAARIGTPAFVVSQTILRQRLLGFAEAMRARWSTTRFFYSIKANPNPWVLREALACGWGLDACSLGDLALADCARASKESVSFAGVGVSGSDLAQAVDAAGFVNICTPAQVDQVTRSGARLGLRLAAIPNRTGIVYTSNKFGLTAEELVEAIEGLARRSIPVSGLHCHVGSGITDEDDFVDTVSQCLLSAMDRLDVPTRGALEYVNIGGGLGIRYDDQQGGVDPVHLGERVAQLMNELSARAGRRLELHCEPGEWVVGPAGALLMRANQVFQRGDTRVVIADASLNQFMGTSYSRPDNALGVVPRRGQDEIKQDVFGATNSPGDAFCRARIMSPVEEGDLIVLHCAGAYGFSRGGHFNEHPQAAEVLVAGSRFALARRGDGLAVFTENVPNALDWRTS
jgi:diaminopimelate decarboxylase